LEVIAMSYIDSRHTAPFGAITLYLIGSALTDAAAAASGLFGRRATHLVALSPAELEDIGLSVADLPERESFFSHVADTVRAWNSRRRTISALSRLSDAQLDDIGLTRWDVEELRAGRLTY
jgi:uncharacterized protein YjiS (DUF1127 family)